MRGCPTYRIAILSTALASVLLQSTPTPPLVAGESFFVKFEHDGLNTTEYRLRINGSLAQTLPLSAGAGGGTITFLMPSGLAAGSHTVLVDAVGAGGVTTAPALTLPISPVPPQPIPAPRSQEAPLIARGVLPTVPTWTSTDIGGALAGTFAQSGGTLTVEGAGADIWGTADAFRFVHQPLTGDGDLVARVVSLEPTNPWAKAGVMLRATLTPGAVRAFMQVTPTGGQGLQWRTTTNGTCAISPVLAGAAPRWLKLTRRGAVFAGYTSTDGLTWALVGTQTLTMPATIFAGLAVTSRNTSQLATAVFTNVAVQ